MRAIFQTERSNRVRSKDRKQVIWQVFQQNRLVARHPVLSETCQRFCYLSYNRILPFYLKLGPQKDCSEKAVLSKSSGIKVDQPVYLAMIGCKILAPDLCDRQPTWTLYFWLFCKHFAAFSDPDLVPRRFLADYSRNLPLTCAFLFALKVSARLCSAWLSRTLKLRLNSCLK